MSLRKNRIFQTVKYSDNDKDIFVKMMNISEKMKKLLYVCLFVYFSYISLNFFVQESTIHLNWYIVIPMVFLYFLVGGIAFTTHYCVYLIVRNEAASVIRNKSNLVIWKAALVYFKTNKSKYINSTFAE
ncbi:hypothetical protein SAMN02982927_02624 [Sporolactobacillus nakayamae]|uniref:Uncharacterized protein n=1 Tax=Sporolactobacillus nakayamae TaxID=269670 RepID=A0A1I2U9P7_9BACL|nr:hypothetical protein SAMN02982927_02624 [Sporolactobacillus nakayamae]